MSLNKENKLSVNEVFAYYLPQYHEVKENNEWWGDGFTEWVNLRNANKIYNDHEILYPGCLGYYELNNPLIIQKQFECAIENGITSFCFWHYWFGDNDKILEKPAELILNSNTTVKFCFAWANHSWWNKTKNILLKEQKYDISIEEHFKYLKPFFSDDRYTKIDGKPVFVIYKPSDFPDFNSTKTKYDELARDNGFPGIFWIGENTEPQNSENFDLYLNSGPFLKYRSMLRRIYDRVVLIMSKNGIKIPRRYDYEKCVNKINSNIDPESNQIPIVFPRWDSTIRHGKGGMYLHGSTPDLFERHVIDCKEILAKKKNYLDRYLFIKSWNEWAEGNFIEPDNKYGNEYLRRFGKHFQQGKK